MHYNCLIVDDEVELAKMTAEYFQMFDITTQYVDSAASCFDFLKYLPITPQKYFWIFFQPLLRKMLKFAII